MSEPCPRNRHEKEVPLMEAMSRLVSECGLEDIVPVSVARDVTGLLPDSGERGGGARGKVVGRVRGAQLRCACEF